MTVINLKRIIFLLLINKFSLFVNGTRKLWNPIEESTWLYMGANKECAEKTIVYPEDHVGLFRLPNAMEINQFVLPQNGIMILQGAIHFIDLDRTLCDPQKDYKYKVMNKQSWFLADNWKYLDSANVLRIDMNSAKPHIDRIPCECDTVIFPNKETVAVDLTFVNELVVDKVMVDDDENGNFEDFLKTELGQFMFPSTDAVTFIRGTCNPQIFCGCHSYQQFYAYEEILCLNEMCTAPTCLNPIKPIGHCCPICGATALINVKQNCSLERDKLTYLIENRIRKIENGEFLNSIDYYVGIVPGNGRKNMPDKIQIVITEKYEYIGESVRFIKLLDNLESFKGPNIKTFYSGMPYDPTKSSSSWLIIFVTLCFVIGFFGILYVHYVEEKSLIPNWITLPKLSKISSPFVFARFENAGNDDGDTDRIDVGVEFSTDIITDESLGGEGSATGFNNPLFTKVSAVEKIETTETTSVEEIQHNEIDENNCESEKLVEIALDDTQDIM